MCHIELGLEYVKDFYKSEMSNFQQVGSPKDKWSEASPNFVRLNQ